MDFSPQKTDCSSPNDVREQSRLLKERALELAALCYDIVAQLDSAILDMSKHIGGGGLVCEIQNDVNQEFLAEGGGDPIVAPNSEFVGDLVNESIHDSGSDSGEKIAANTQCSKSKSG